MRIIIIRHGDPDYEHDSLTPRGDTEAKLLADIIDRYKIDYFYVSPLGRAQRTAAFSLEKLGKSAETLDWLQEFPPRILRPDAHGKRTIAWDWRPADWTKIPDMYDKDKWCLHPIMREGGVDLKVALVYDGLDGLLARHGYERAGKTFPSAKPGSASGSLPHSAANPGNPNPYNSNLTGQNITADRRHTPNPDTLNHYSSGLEGENETTALHQTANGGTPNTYRAVRSNHDTIALVCHFGVECVMLGHLLGISPMPLWHGFVSAPTGITSIFTEERRKGIASFRVNEFGETPHLMLGGVEPSKRARFVECFEDSAEGLERDDETD